MPLPLHVLFLTLFILPSAHSSPCSEEHKKAQRYWQYSPTTSVAVTESFPAHSDLDGNNQVTDTVLMVWPDDFAYNVETAATNDFQNNRASATQLQIRDQAMKEFETMVKTLRDEGVRVLTIHSREDAKTPDAVFPNNWLSTHLTPKGERIFILYPMLTPNRQLERQSDVIISLFQSEGVSVRERIDLTGFEKCNIALEGTGSLVLDRVSRTAFASISPRTHIEVLNEFCAQTGYTYVSFHSYGRTGNLIYHTNVVMSIGQDFAVICSACIRDQSEKETILRSLRQLKRDVIEISLDQMENMCGNILQVKNTSGEKLIVMSKRAHSHFTEEQRKVLQGHGKLVPVDIQTIEDVGGGSARCMIAEIFWSVLEIVVGQ